jgi:hypothetical protein
VQRKEEEKGDGEEKNIQAVDKIFNFNENYYNFGLLLSEVMNFKCTNGLQY